MEPGISRCPITIVVHYCVLDKYVDIHFNARFVALLVCRAFCRTVAISCPPQCDTTGDSVTKHMRERDSAIKWAR